jgi:hypothetical protein
MLKIDLALMWPTKWPTPEFKLEGNELPITII